VNPSLTRFEVALMSRWRATSLAFYWIFILRRSVSEALSRRQRIVVSPFLAYASGYQRGQMRNFNTDASGYNRWFRREISPGLLRNERLRNERLRNERLRNERSITGGFFCPLSRSLPAIPAARGRGRNIYRPMIDLSFLTSVAFRLAKIGRVIKFCKAKDANVPDVEWSF